MQCPMTTILFERNMFFSIYSSGVILGWNIVCLFLWGISYAYEKNGADNNNWNRPMSILRGIVFCSFTRSTLF